MSEVINEKCACCGANLDRFVQPVMLSIIARQPCNGYAVVKGMTDYATFENGGADAAGVYRYLKLMQKKGLIEQNPVEEDGRQAMIYTITQGGTDCLENWTRTLKEYSLQIDRLVKELEQIS